ncbi:Threonine synthase [bacterium HR08]|nr:Threonine synthase [bacterium HR08]
MPGREHIWQRYAAWLGLENPMVSLGEGDTPLVRSWRIGPRLGFERLYFKLESLNPTGSFKDRFVVLEIADMLRSGQRVCLATSSGNTGSALAAYAARSERRCVIFVSEQTPDAKLQQMLAYGAHIYRVREFGRSAEITRRTFERLHRFATERGYRLVVSAFRYSPLGMQGVKTLAFEIADALPTVDHVFVPVGGGGLLTALWYGFDEWARGGRVQRVPRLHAVQPVGCAPVVRAWRRGEDRILPVEARTEVSGLAVPFDIDGALALTAVRASGGAAWALPDEQIWEAQAMLCHEEGIFAEPAGAAALAGFLAAIRENALRPEESVVCLVTGHGFKDLTAMERISSAQAVPLIEAEEIFELPFA